MIINITKNNFENNLFTQITESNCLLVLNSVQEHAVYNVTSQDVKHCEVDAINIQLMQEKEGTVYYLSLPNIIGLGNDYISIESSYKELLGKPLTLDNIDKCTIIVSKKKLKD